MATITFHPEELFTFLRDNNLLPDNINRRIARVKSAGGVIVVDVYPVLKLKRTVALTLTYRGFENDRLLFAVNANPLIDFVLPLISKSFEQGAVTLERSLLQIDVHTLIGRHFSVFVITGVRQKDDHFELTTRHE